MKKINYPLPSATDDITWTPPKAGREDRLYIQERHSRTGSLPLGSRPLWYVAEKKGGMSLLVAQASGHSMRWKRMAGPADGLRCPLS